jgi:hypothetical protein
VLPREKRLAMTSLESLMISVVQLARSDTSPLTLPSFLFLGRPGGLWGRGASACPEALKPMHLIAMNYNTCEGDGGVVKQTLSPSEMPPVAIPPTAKGTLREWSAAWSG